MGLCWDGSGEYVVHKTTVNLSFLESELREVEPAPTGLENLQARVAFMFPVLWGQDLGSRVLVLATGSNVHGS